MKTKRVREERAAKAEAVADRAKGKCGRKRKVSGREGYGAVEGETEAMLCLLESSS